jgi:drug/metabolite transporter superfamily protein YnfA
MTPHALAPAAFAILIVLSLYWRFRRLFGRQRVQQARMKFRIGFLLVIGALLMLRGLSRPDIAMAMAAGLAGGVGLALLGLRLTRFEDTPQGRFYTPHGGIGLALSALLAGRLAYRYFVIWPALQAHGGNAGGFGDFQRSALTSALFALLIGYYVAYYAGVLIKNGAGASRGATRDPPAQDR